MIVAPEEALDTHGMAEREDGCLAVDLQTANLGIGIEGTGGVFDFGLHFRRADTDGGLRLEVGGLRGES